MTHTTGYLQSLPTLLDADISTLVNYLDCFRTPDRLLYDWADTRALDEVLPRDMPHRFEQAVTHPIVAFVGLDE